MPVRMRSLTLGTSGFVSALGFGVLLGRKEVDAREVEPPGTALVIGGGVIGVSTAYQLAMRGVAVTVLEEREQVAQVSSQLSPWAAMLCRCLPTVTAPSCASPWRLAGPVPGCWQRTQGRSRR